MERTQQSSHGTNRRSFMPKGVAVGARAAGVGRLFADPPQASAHGGLTKGDVAILQFLAAAEVLEADLRAQYNELGGVQDSEVPGGYGNPAYTAALAYWTRTWPNTSTTTPTTSRAMRTSSTPT
jgi:hypothetical protein